MAKFKYLVEELTLPEHSRQRLQDHLDGLGNDGWELVTMVISADRLIRHIGIFKRKSGLT